MRTYISAFLFILFLSSPVAVISRESRDKEDIKGKQLKNAAMENVKKVIVYYKKHGKVKTLKELSNSKGRFVLGSLYAFAYDMEGTVIAHPINSSLIGGKLHDIPDENGKFFRREIVYKAKTVGKGWVEYKYSEPDKGLVQQKITYLETYDKIIFCCGFYR